MLINMSMLQLQVLNRLTFGEDITPVLAFTKFLFTFVLCNSISLDCQGKSLLKI